MLFDTKKLPAFPSDPGVYLMKDKNGQILYVGKAKNLKKRVKQYFMKSGDGREMLPFLVEKVFEIETIIVGSEKEALLLENTLIKQHQPKYNVIFKDDKSYVCIKITDKQKWPLAQVVRLKGEQKKGEKTFGPYISAGAARETLELINRTFPLRQCSDQEFSRRTRPCILYQMHRCVAPCVGLCSKEEYDRHVEQAISFLEGKNKKLLIDLKADMIQASDDLEYEKAGDILRKIQRIERTIEKQKVDQVDGIDTDVVGLYRYGADLVVNQLIYRQGSLVASKNFLKSRVLDEDSEVIERFLIQFYGEGENLPQEILLPLSVKGDTCLESFLNQNSTRKLTLLSPKRGEKVHLVEMAQKNAKAFFHKEKDEKEISQRVLLELQDKLKLIRFPKRIECMDNSHLSGDEPVASMVTFTEGKEDKKRYRKYKLRDTDPSDDYGAMKEVLTRRYSRGKMEDDLPDLLIVDGGKGQLNIALKVLSDLDIVSIDLIGLAKEEGRHDKGLTEEKIFLPNKKDPIRLQKRSSSLFLLQRIRDEAHRFAITFHKQRRSKKYLQSEIEKLPGFGPVKCKKVLKIFGSIKKLKLASEEEIRSLKGFSERDRSALLDFITQSS